MTVGTLIGYLQNYPLDKVIVVRDKNNTADHDVAVDNEQSISVANVQYINPILFEGDRGFVLIQADE